MNASDSAEEVVKLTLEGTEVAFRLAGEGAKNIIVMIHAISCRRFSKIFKRSKKIWCKILCINK